MTTIQLHVDAELAGEQRVRIYHVTRPAGLPDNAPSVQRYVGALQLPPWLIQELDRLTPIVERLIADEVRVMWTGHRPPALPVDPMLEKTARLVKALKRVFGRKAPALTAGK